MMIMLPQFDRNIPRDRDELNRQHIGEELSYDLKLDMIHIFQIVFLRIN